MKTIIKIFIFFYVLSFAVSKTYAQLNVSVTVAPPELPVYVQPPCPVDGFIWEPGYWAYDDVDGYYWVPGVWVAPPEIGYLWTPCYWGFVDGLYGFYPGYWGLEVGFYGGINYGYGYSGWGYGGGRWEGDHFRYNTAVVIVNTTVIHNTYVDNSVVNNAYVNNHKSFNGPGGVTASPRPEEQAAMKEPHIPPTTAQVSHQQVARKDPNQFVNVNNGHPAAAVMDKVGGRPLDEHGHVATNSTLGRASANRNPAPNRPTTNVNPNRPATNVNPNRPATNVNPGRPVISQSKQRTQPQPQRQQHAQPQPSQRVQYQQRPAQPQQRMQQNRPAQQPRPNAPEKQKHERP